MEAAAAPRTTGEISEAMPNTRVHVPCQADPGSPWARKAKAAPRNTMPRRARENGRYGATDRSANTPGNAARSPVRTKISQT
ncbi:hypothetical protein HRbin12_01398 [bacterium HR12]|nr:hypothetical protein HRbin12_01398 [bacterium HR12]